jgi:hypothetical protein
VFTNLTIAAGAALDTAGYSAVINGTFSNNGTPYRRGGDYVSKTDVDSGMVVYRTTGGAVQYYSGTDYYDLTINETGQTFTLSGPISVARNLTIAAGVLDVTAGNHSVTVGGNWTNPNGGSGFTRAAAR